MGDATVNKRVRPGRAVDLASPAPVQNMRVEEGTCLVQRIMYGVETIEQEAIRVPLFETDPARVSVSGGLTRSLGGFEYARIDIKVELPCYPERSEVERAYQLCQTIVDEKLAEQSASVDEQLNTNPQQQAIG